MFLEEQFKKLDFFVVFNTLKSVVPSVPSQYKNYLGENKYSNPLVDWINKEWRLKLNNFRSRYEFIFN